jgi:hypothetical protein
MRVLRHLFTSAAPRFARSRRGPLAAAIRVFPVVYAKHFDAVFGLVIFKNRAPIADAQPILVVALRLELLHIDLRERIVGELPEVGFDLFAYVRVQLRKSTQRLFAVCDLPRRCRRN